MSSGIFYPAASGDDGYWRTGAFNSNGAAGYIGNYSGSSLSAWFRFQNVTIPKDSVISSAFVRFTAYQDQTNVDVNVDIFFNAADNAIAPTSEGEADALALTAAVSWNGIPAWIANVQYDTPDISSVLQEVIDRAGWVDNNAVQIVIKDDNSTASVYRTQSTFDYSGGSQKAELHVTWGDPPPLGSSTFYPSVSNDDGVRSGDTGFVTDATSMLLGKSGDVPQRNFIRFTDVTIPQGSRIKKAQLKATAAATCSTENVTLGHAFVDADNPDAPTTYQEFDALEHTSTCSSLSVPSWIDGEQYTLPVYTGGYFDFKDLLQEVVNRSGFSSGNAVILLTNGVLSDTDANRSISTIDYDSGSEKPGLYVEWAGEESAGEWVEVAPQLGTETYIYSLTEFNGKLYGCTGDNGRLYEWNGSDTWVEVASQLGSETVINCLVEFNGKLYGGTGPNAKLYEWNGIDVWIEVAPRVLSEYHIQSLIVFQGKLYGGTVRNGLLVEWNGVDAWTVVAEHHDEEGIYSLAVFNNDLYGGTGDGTPPNGGALLFKWNEVDSWEKVAYRNHPDNRIVALAVFNNKIYGAGWMSGRLLEWNSAGYGTWIEVAPQLGSEKVVSLLVFNDKLYGGTRESGKLYVWNNTNAWSVVSPQLEEARILSLAEFNSKLYGGTGITGKLYTWGEIVLGNISVSLPMMQVEGHTGSYEANVSLPMMQTEGYTGIAASAILPMAQVTIFQGVTTSNIIPMCQVEGLTGVFSDVSVPMPVANITGHDNIEHSSIAVTIPSMTASLSQTLQIEANVSIPAMTASIKEREKAVANVSIPMMTAALSTGLRINASCTAPMMTSAGLFSGQCEVTAPMMTVEMEGMVGRVIRSNITLPMMSVEGEFGAQGEVTIPMMKVSLEGKVGRVINSDITVPMMTVEIVGKTEHLGNIDVSIPMMRVAAHLMTGKVINGAVTIPMMEAALTSYEEITGDIDVSVPMMEAYMIGTIERAVCTILRYNDLPDCIGDIVVDVPMQEASLTEA